jgi:dTDP-4-dehydrorhamnose 3,5-epimerase
MPIKIMPNKNDRFYFHPTPFEGLYVAERKPITDHRGFFCRFFSAQEFQSVGLLKPIVQINHTHTMKKGAVRGLHFQYPPHAEWKIVSCIRGEVFDVAVDIRKGSPTFLRWHGEILSDENRKSLLIPEGFAHGFQALSEDCELIYLHSAPYCAQSEGAIHVNDPRIEVVWPIPITDISDRDYDHPFLPSDFEGIVL